MASAAQLEALIEALYGVAFVSKGEVAAAALYLWDYLLTVGMEIELVWTSRWNVIKVLFLVQRYLPLLDTCILTLYRDLQPGRTGNGCTVIEMATGFMYVGGYVVAEALLTFRVWALWERSRTLAFILPVAFAVCWAPAFVVMYYFQQSLRFSPAPIPGVPGCFVIAASEILKWCWVSLIIWNAFTLFLMLIPGMRHYRSQLHSSLLYSVVYRDGTFYFFFLFVLSIINIVLTVTVVPTKRFFISSLERCLHSMLASRVILHMRDHARLPPEWESGRSEVEFALPPRQNGTVISVRSQVDPSRNYKASGLH
ncbi:hypothetical protein GALMADRAFT_252945 [Galerina marginata CBS 339.88]|uniref:DUF6533 domain-containing protein n=1 Tax=Galerina marginata (strain CBS 339.88) TaxID=685588 RepID=A0A067SP96_GALM3|nr:hypothetical protein GALMADRAFT_252945 [Galerina marginata CBS 339.88]